MAAYDATVSREFYAGLDISNLEAESLEAPLAETEVQKVSVLDTACEAAQLALGEDQVDLAPLNQTIVGENWYTFSSPSLCGLGEHKSTGLKLVSLSRTASCSL